MVQGCSAVRDGVRRRGRVAADELHDAGEDSGGIQVSRRSARRRDSTRRSCPDSAGFLRAKSGFSHFCSATLLATARL